MPGNDGERLFILVCGGEGEQRGPDICPHDQLNMAAPPHITGF